MCDKSVGDGAQLPGGSGGGRGEAGQAGQLLMTVRDTGCGIPDKIKDKIFEKGFSTKGSGRGVGMYYTKQLVESLGGTISFESEEDIGTSFMVQLRGSYV